MEEAAVIGRGTWLDKVADELLKRENNLGRSLSLVRVESGLGASGVPHIGSVGDAVRSYGIKLALQTRGYRSELIAYSDDFDGLRKVPSGFPDNLKEYIAHPVSRIPDPFGCHRSYGEHMGSLLRESMDRIGIEYTFMSGSEAYKKGLLNEQVRKILSNSEKIGRRIKEMVGQEKFEKLLPYFPVCHSCGRLYTTVSTNYDGERDTISYRCQGTELGDSFLKGCGYEGEAKVSDGEGKLSWKGEFAARWSALDIRFEAYGKELTDSVEVNDWISSEIFGFPPPYHVRYELFQDKSGRKFSKSTGNLVTPQEWLSYASPGSLRLLMFKRIAGARNISLDDIPTYMEELDDLEEYYFSNRKDPNVLKDARLRGLYEYSTLLKPPMKASIHVPYRLLAGLSSSAPESEPTEYVMKRLIAYGMAKEVSDELKRRIEWSSKWAKRGDKTAQQTVELTAPLAAALEEFALKMPNSRSPEEVQTLAFETIRNHGLKPHEFFSAVYLILLGSNRGPRLGPYVVDWGVDVVSERIRAGVAASKG